MLLVLWVIRLLNGADITPGGQGVGFDCVIEFCSPPTPPFFFFLFFFGKLRGRFFCCGWSLGSRSMSSVPVGSQGFSARGSPWRPLQEKMCARVSAERVRLVCLWGMRICVRACVYVPFCVCVSVFVPQSAWVLCCAVTCSQISQRIYHPVNCLWVVDKMAPIHSHMKTLRG